jgi:uncharacterized protein
LTVTGEIDERLTVRRSKQNRETDLAYLYRLSRDYGYGFNVRGTDLVFYSLFQLEGEAAKKTIELGKTVSYAFRAKTAETYTAATLSYHNPDTQEVVEFKNEELVFLRDGENTLDYFLRVNNEAAATVQTEPSNADPDNPALFREGEDTLDYFLRSRDTLKVYEKAKDPATAAAKTRAALHRKNSQAVTGSLVVVGDVTLLAGNNIELTGAGKFSGKYHIESSRHSITPAGGYGTSIEIKKVG